MAKHLSAPPRSVSQAVSRQLLPLALPFDQLLSQSQDIKSAAHYDALEESAHAIAGVLVSAFRGTPGQAA